MSLAVNRAHLEPPFPSETLSTFVARFLSYTLLLSVHARACVGPWVAFKLVVVLSLKNIAALRVFVCLSVQQQCQGNTETAVCETYIPCILPETNITLVY